MFQLFALTIDNSTLVFTFGAFVLIVAFFLDGSVGKWIAIAGIGLLVFGFVLKAPSAAPVNPYPPYPTPTPGPGPAPTPTPYPPPAPAPTSFATGVWDAFKSDGGNPDDAIILSAMFDQYAMTLEYDSTQQPPRIATANDLGNSFRRLQQYRFGQPVTPFGQKYPRFESYIAAEMTRTGLDNGPLDPVKRNNAVLMFRTVASALRGTP